MNIADNIVHEGTVEKIINGVAFISFRQSSGCSGCSIKSSCGMADSTDKILQIPLKGTTVHEGDDVEVHLSKGQGYRAVVISYFIPFLLVVGSLILSLQLGVTEPLAGVVALAVLIPYYGMLRLFSNTFQNQLTIEVQKR